MSTAIKIPAQPKSASGRFVLDDVSWAQYTQFLRAFDERSAIRLTYDRGRLEIMTLSHEHESFADFLGRMATTLTEELNLSIKAGRSTTFRRRDLNRGLEPDNSYWITSEPKVRGKRKIDLRSDPPPDLAIEIDISRSSVGRMSIYGSLGVRELWRFDGRILTFHILQPDGSYGSSDESGIFPGLRPNDLVRFLRRLQHDEENTVIRQFRTWVRSRIAAGWR